MEKHKTTLDEAILIAKTISLTSKIDAANFSDFMESKTFEEYESRRGIMDLDEDEFNFLKRGEEE